MNARVLAKLVEVCQTLAWDFAAYLTALNRRYPLRHRGDDVQDLPDEYDRQVALFPQ